MDVESQEALKVRRYHRRMASNVTHQPQSHSSMSMEICKLLVWTVILIKMIMHQLAIQIGHLQSVA